MSLCRLSVCLCLSVSLSLILQSRPNYQNAKSRAEVLAVQLDLLAISCWTARNPATPFGEYRFLSSRSPKNDVLSGGQSTVGLRPDSRFLSDVSVERVISWT